MSSRGHGQPSYGGRSTQPPGMMRHGSYPTNHTTESHHSDHSNDSNKLISQTTEIERLITDNQRLATTHVALRQDLVATQQDIQKVRAHIGSIQTESDIQIRILLDKIAKMEGRIRVSENVKKDLQNAHNEARGLVLTRQELIGQIEESGKELEKVSADVAKVPAMHVELDGLRQEHQKLRSTFEQEKGKNMEKVAQMEVMEKELVGMAREVERLRAEVSNAEKRANAPPNIYGGPYMNQEPYPPPPPHMHMSGGGYIDAYGNHHHVPMGTGEGMIPYGGVHHGPAPPGNPQWGPPPTIPYGAPHPGPPPPPNSNPQWGGPPYDNSYPRT